MKQCPVCGCELNDTALFCKNCGAQAKSADSVLQTDTEAAKNKLLDLSVRLRELCDDMTAAYVDAVKTLEMKDAAQQANIDALEARLTELKERLEEMQAENARLSKELNDSSVVNNRLFAEKMRLEQELEDCKAAAGYTVIASPETQQDLSDPQGQTVYRDTPVYYEPDNEETGRYCPNCGALVSAGAVFCGNCGARVN